MHEPGPGGAVSRGASTAALFAVAGAFWGAVAYLLGARAFGPVIWPGVVAAPAIGVAVGALLQRPFECTEGWRRSALALASLYLGSTLFGLAMGLGTWAEITSGSRNFPGVVVEPVLAVWWGLTIGGFFIVLWPLAYLTHRVIAFRLGRLDG